MDRALTGRARVCRCGHRIGRHVCPSLTGEEQPATPIRIEKADSLSAVDRRMLQQYWDDDARTYDRWPEHGAQSRVERAAWAATLGPLLPPVGARVLDVGAGTGCLSLVAARLGYKVTALDISPGMLERLEEAAAREGLTIETICASADEIPAGPFDVVMARLLLWMLPDPAATLSIWRESVADGTLLAFEGLSGGRLGAFRRRAQDWTRRWQGLPPEHHRPFPTELSAHLRSSPRGPEALISFIEQAGWQGAQLMPLDAVKFARRTRQRRLRPLLGVTQEYVMTGRSGH
jgi:SAM-dependent methyltransferase